MICPKCNVKLSNESKYCPRCGTLFESDDVKKYSEAFNTDFMEIYFPNKELKFHIDRVSIGYALFTYFYAIYKKMYKVAIISFLLQLFLVKGFEIISSLGEASIAIFFPILFIIMLIAYVYFYYVFNFDRLLIENRIIRINRILRNNDEKEKNDIIKIMKNDSKNDIRGVIIAISIVVIYILLKIFLL